MLIENRSRLRGEITVPGDKSISHRSIVIGALAKGTTQIDNFLLSEDCISTIECFRKMQVKIEILQNQKIKVHGNGLYGLKAPTSPLNTGRSGTSLRLLLGILCGQHFVSDVIRNEYEMKKPIGEIVNHLKLMGADIKGRDNGNLCPITVSPSTLEGIDIELSEYETQLKSPLLLAGLFAHGETVVNEAVQSRNHTELMLNYFGADIRTDGLRVRSSMVENLYARDISIPGDISMASYFIAAALLVPNSDIVIKNVGVNPTRAGVLEVFKKMGAKIELLNPEIKNNESVADIHVVSSNLKGVKIDKTQAPALIDELPIIAVAAAFAEGTTEITGLAGSKTKDSGKIKALATELSKMGSKATETDDGLIIEGKEALRGTVIESHNSHSLAMALSIAGLAAQGETTIRKTQIVDIVYPSFYETINRL